jgi:cytochrome d ubiquinol oxidase subunit II
MPIVWSALVLLCLLMYVLLDGYDLGIGIGALFERDAERRREMLEQVALAWDGNETWLVLLGVSLWAGFPLAFGTILPHAYLAVVVVLFSLIVRGVAVEMASQAPPAPRWERAFAVASLVAALAQGVAVATLVQKLTVTDGAYSGSPFGAIGWFSVLAALTVGCVYLTLGYAYLKLRTAGDLRAAAGRRGTVAAGFTVVLVAASLGAVSATAAPLNLQTAGRAVGFTGLLLFGAAGLVVALVTLRPASRLDSLPFAGMVVAVVALLAAVVVARAPVIVPPALTISDSASPSLTMEFLAVGIGLNMPLILFYTWFAQHSFRRTAAGAAKGQDLAFAGAVHDHH